MNSDVETYFHFPRRKLWWQLDSRAVPHRCYWRQGLHPSCKSTYGIPATISFFCLYCYWLKLFTTGYCQTERGTNQKVWHCCNYHVSYTLTFKCLKYFKTPPAILRSWWHGSRGHASPASLQTCSASGDCQGWWSALTWMMLYHTGVENVQLSSSLSIWKQVVRIGDIFLLQLAMSW